LKALALGARLAFVGRPFAYAAAVAGKAGVAHGITLLKEEVSRNMAMLGICGLNEMTMDRLVALDRQAASIDNIATDERAA
jgi:L-lactate dehydrogenase (cytochrome)